MTPYYRDEWVTLYHGDWRDVYLAVGMQQFDHLITDPPYDARTHKNARSNKHGDEAIIHFDAIDAMVVGQLLAPLARRWSVVFCALEQIGKYKEAVGEKRWTRAGFWYRPDGMPQRTGDRPAQPGEGLAIWHGDADRRRWNSRGKRGFYSYGVVRGSERVHDTQKPLGLMLELIDDFTDISESIFDPYAGSGTTGVAAKQRGRHATLIEVDESTCEKAATRLARTQPDLIAQSSLLEA